MNRLLLAFTFVVASCASRTQVTPTVPESSLKRVEEQELPPDPKTEKLPEDSDIPPGDWVVSLEKGSCVNEDGVMVNDYPCPELSGILSSEERAYRNGLFRLRYKELRANYQADKELWKVHRELYETRLNLAAQAIEDLQPSWWDRNKLQIGVVGGIVLGMASSVAVVVVTEQLR